jgi:hypothetical protein
MTIIESELDGLSRSRIRAGSFGADTAKSRWSEADAVFDELESFLLKNWLEDLTTIGDLLGCLGVWCELAR